MAELIQQRDEQITDSQGVIYNVLVYGDERSDGTWEGWIEFHPANKIQPALRTERETSQPNRNALAYWVSGLEAIYIEGALARAK